MDKELKIVMLVGKARSSSIMYNAIIEEFPINCVIEEEPVSMVKIMRNRAGKIGYFNVFGQILFGLLVLPVMRFFSKKQTESVISNLKVNLNPIPSEKKILVSSVNSDECLNKLKELKPDLVIVNGCRIISRKILRSINAVFINTHEGITPKYRGIHGCYWALVNNDKKNCGVTVHLVDEGVDTGGILYQETVLPTSKDNFTTYPLYQTAKGSIILINAIRDFYNNNLKIINGVEGNHIWYHPTIWQYFYYRFTRGIK